MRLSGWPQRPLKSVLTFIFLGFLSTTFAFSQDRPTRGRIVYEGTYHGKQIEGFVLFNQGPELVGAITLTAEFDGPAVVVTYRTTGKLPNGRATGLIEGNVCKLFGPRELKIEAECTGDSFKASLFEQPRPELRRNVTFNLTRRVESNESRNPALPSQARAPSPMITGGSAGGPASQSSNSYLAADTVQVFGLVKAYEKIDQNPIPRRLAEQLIGRWQSIQTCVNGELRIGKVVFEGRAKRSPNATVSPAESSQPPNWLRVFVHFLRDSGSVMTSMSQTDWESYVAISDQPWNRTAGRFQMQESHIQSTRPNPNALHEALSLVQEGELIKLSIPQRNCPVFQLERVDKFVLIGDLSPNATMPTLPSNESVLPMAARLFDTSSGNVLLKKPWFVRYDGRLADRTPARRDWLLIPACLKSDPGCSPTSDQLTHTLIVDLERGLTYGSLKPRPNEEISCVVSANAKNCSRRVYARDFFPTVSYLAHSHDHRVDSILAIVNRAHRRVDSDSVVAACFESVDVTSYTEVTTVDRGTGRVLGKEDRNKVTRRQHHYHCEDKVTMQPDCDVFAANHEVWPVVLEKGKRFETSVYCKLNVLSESIR